MLGNFGIFSFLGSCKLTRFFTTRISATSFKIWTFSAFLYLSETTLTIFFQISSHKLRNVLTLIHCNTLKFQGKPILRAGQKSALQHSLFWRYDNFSNLMRTIHISMTSTFQCEYCQCFTFKRYDKLKLQCTSHGGMYSENFFGKNSITSKQWML